MKKAVLECGVTSLDCDKLCKMCHLKVDYALNVPRKIQLALRVVVINLV